MPHNSHEFNVRREEQLLAVFPITKKKIKKIYIYITKNLNMAQI